MKPNIARLLIAILLVTTLFGCTQMTRTEKNLCFTLATQSYSYVPNCETESSCYDKVSEMFHTSLGYEQESLLYDLKNSLARSWFFYNKAIKETKTIRDLCQAGNASGLTGSLNQSRYFMQQSLIELDYSMKKSFEIIKAEETLLSEEKIDLIKEDELYFSLIEFRQIIAELNSGETNSNTYFSYYQNKVKEFTNSSQAKGFPLASEKAPIWISGFTYLDKMIVLDQKETTLGQYFQSSKLFDTLAAYFENAFFTKEALLNLQNFPINNFMELYSNIGGNNNSTIKRFADLINKTSDNYTKTEKYSSSGLIEIDAKYLLCAKKVAEYNSLKNQATLYSLLFGKTISTEDEIDNTLLKIALTINQLKEKIAQENIGLGEVIYEIKSINTNEDLLLSIVSSTNDSALEQTHKECERISNAYIKPELTETGNELNTIIEETYFFAQKTKNTASEEKLSYCLKFVEKRGQLEKAINNYEEYISSQKTLTLSCLTNLEKLLSYKNVPQLNEQYEYLKHANITKDNLAWALNYCESISMQIDAQIKTDSIFMNLENEFAKLIDLSNEIKQNLNFISDTSILNDAKTQLKSTDRLFEYFSSDGKAIVVKIIGLENTILKSIEENNASTSELLKKCIVDYIKKNHQLIVDSNTITELNNNIEQKGVLYFNNPFRTIKTYFEIESTEQIKFIAANDCVRIESYVQKPKIVFDCINTGITKLDIIIVPQLSKIETDELIRVTSDEGIIKRTISFVGKNLLMSALIKTTPPINTTKTIITYEQKEPVFFFNGARTQLEIGPILLDTKKSILATFFVSGILQSKATLENIETINGVDKHTYILTATSTFPENLTADLFFKIPGIEFSHNLVLQTNSARQINKQIKNSLLIIERTNFFPKESKSFKLYFELNNSREAYKLVLEQQRDFFYQNNMLIEAEKLNEFVSLLFEKSLIDIAKEIEANNLLIEKQKQIELNNASIILLQKQLNDKIALLNEKADVLEENGFIEEAKRIREINSTINSGEINGCTATQLNNLSKEISSINANILIEMRKKVLQMQTSMQKIVKEVSSPALNFILKDFLAKKSEFDIALIKSESDASEIYTQILGLFNAFLVEKEKVTQPIQVSIEDEKKFNALLTDCNKLIQNLETMLIGKEKELIESKFIQPITENRLKQLKYILTELTFSDSNIAVKIQAAAVIKNELLSAYNSIKSQAITAFNLAIDSKEDNTILNKSKSFIDSNNFVDAYLLLKSQSLVAESIPFAGFIPIGLIVIVALILRQKFNSGEKSKKDKQQKLIEEWEKI